MKRISLCYIGDKYYHESGTIMSPVYRNINGRWHRWDWGLIQVALAKGFTITVIPAKPSELEEADKMLAEVRSNAK